MVVLDNNGTKYSAGSGVHTGSNYSSNSVCCGGYH